MADGGDMTKDVIVTICGRQFDIGGEPVELVLPGTYYLKNGKHYVLYEEPQEESGRIVKNRVKFHDGHFDMVKNGAVSSALKFLVNERTSSLYKTGAGAMMMETDTRNIIISETDNLLHVNVSYDLYINGQFISDCEVDFRVAAV